MKLLNPYKRTNKAESLSKLRGNLHIHGPRSRDENGTPGDGYGAHIRDYVNRKYNFLMFTEFSENYVSCKELNEIQAEAIKDYPDLADDIRELVLLPGMELAGGAGKPHFSVSNLNEEPDEASLEKRIEEINVAYTNQNYSDAINLTHKSGGFSICAHPNDRSNWASADFIAKQKMLLGMEVATYGIDPGIVARREAFDLWDQVLNKRFSERYEPIWGFGADDSWGRYVGSVVPPPDRGRYWIVAWVEGLQKVQNGESAEQDPLVMQENRAKILNTIQQGRFYIRSAARYSIAEDESHADNYEIDCIEMCSSNDTIKINLNNPAYGRAIISQNRPDDPTTRIEEQPLMLGQPSQEFEFEISSEVNWVRFRFGFKDSGNPPGEPLATAWTQPITTLQR